MNNAKYQTESFKAKQAQTIDRRFGPIQTFVKICKKCSKEYNFIGRSKTKSFSESKFCSRSCANSTGGSAKAAKYHEDSQAHYRTVAFRHRDKKCYACGHDKILEVHHLDGNHSNNDPTNLVPLCSTHHRMIHSRWKNDVLVLLKEGLHYGK